MLNKTLIGIARFAVLALAAMGHAGLCAAAQSSANYAIPEDSVNAGVASMNSANYRLNSTLGQPVDTTRSISANTIEYPGFWYAGLNGSLTPQPYASLTPSSVNFGTQTVTTTSSTRTATLTNTGNATLNMAIAISGDFGDTGCGTTLAPGASCQLSLTFTPTALGARAGQLTISSNALNGPASITLAGTGATAITTTSVSESVPTSAAGQLVTFTATISGGVNATGTVQFKDNGVNIGAPVAVTAGIAQLTINTLGVGTHNITAVYSGDANNAGSTTSAGVTEVVTSGGPAVPSMPDWAALLLGALLVFIGWRRRQPRLVRA